jgi:protein-tyrosine phosphatase
LKDIPKLLALGCQRVVTIQAGNEGALQIGRVVQQSGMAWTWIPVGHGKFPEGEADRLIRGARLEAGEVILVHCSAGIHRTGMLAFALLRWCGADEAEAIEAIGAMRPETLTGMREDHLAWGNLVVSQMQQ